MDSESKQIPKQELESLPEEGPPGVSPAESPKIQTITKRVNSGRERTSSSRHKHRSRDESPRRHHRNHRSPPYDPAYVNKCCLCSFLK